MSKVYSRGCCTNQRTELYAILYAIKYIDNNFDLSKCKIIIRTDSDYSINSITKWAVNHSKNDWRKKNGDPIANREFIEPIYNYYMKYDIEMEWVEAHTGYSDSESMANAEADSLANSAAKRASSQGVTCSNIKSVKSVKSIKSTSGSKRS